MKEEILTLVRSLCRPTADEQTLSALCDAVCCRLDGMLAEGVTAQDCAQLYVTAAAWLVMDLLKDAMDWQGVTTLSAGDMTVRRQAGGGDLEQRALELMGPWLRDRDFVFRGVRV